MKSFNQFCKDANLQEFWWLAKEPPMKPQPPKQEVLAYKNYKSGVLNKSTGKFTEKKHTPEEQKKYGWKPVQVSSYSPTDTPGGKPTASGKPFGWKTPPNVAVPYRYKKGEVPKGSRAGEPSVPFGSKVTFTQSPQGTRTKTSSAEVTDTGNFGPAGDVNKKTSFDLSPTAVKGLTGRNIPAPQFGKRMVYAKVSPSSKPNK